MLSRLKSLELQGYKTFANRTVFEFPGAVTAIVGPNGSGKSNITDALRWVLGEQSYSLLRGKKTEDMIFAGSERRTRSGMATATVILDNSDNWLPIDYSEVSIARRAYRDGSNEYLLNGQKVRLKDVSELLAESGLAERTYTIIGQGLVDAALALRAEDRRRLFEEAAGIGLHRTRRQEALRRLDETQRNLERVDDILHELRPRLRSLERQARRAQEYDQAVADLRSLLRDWYGYHWHKAQEELSEAQKAASSQSEFLESIREKELELDAEIGKIRDQRGEIRVKLNELHRKSTELNIRREENSRELAVSEERARNLEVQELKLKADLALAQEEIQLLNERRRFAMDEVGNLTAEFEDAEASSAAMRSAFTTRLSERADAESKLSAAREELIKLSNLRETLNSRRAEFNVQVSSLATSRKNAELSNQEAMVELEKIGNKVKDVGQKLNAAETSYTEISGSLEQVHGRLSDVEGMLQKEGKSLVEKEAELAKLILQLDILKHSEQSSAGYAAGAKAVLMGLGGSTARTQGVLGEQIIIAEEYEVAVGAVLGEFADAVLLNSYGEINPALQLLENESEPGALLPLDLYFEPTAGDFSGTEGVIARAADLVEVPESLVPAVELLLGNTWVVADRKVALNILETFRKSRKKGVNEPARFVTLRGEVLFSSGPIRTGSGSAPASIRQTRQRREIEAAIQELETQVGECRSQVRKVELELQQARDTASVLQAELQKAEIEREEVNAAHSQVLLAYEQANREFSWRDEQIKTYAADIELLLVDGAQAEKELQQVESEIVAVQKRVDAEQERLEELPIEGLQAEISHWDTRLEILRQGVRATQARLDEREQLYSAAETRLASIDTNILEIQETRNEIDDSIKELKQNSLGIAEEIEVVSHLMNPAETELEAMEDKLSQLMRLESKERVLTSQAEQNFTQARITHIRKQEALDGLRRQIESDFGLVAFEYHEDVTGPTPLPLEGIVEDLPLREELSPQLGDDLKRQRALLRRIGPINPEAQVEYQDVSERYEFLTSQMADLQEATEDVQRVIAELDEIMQREFCNTFDAVAEEFHQIFGRLFGGGSARLILTDPDDLTNTGIDIEARLPGRREQGLSLLSGGERSLTAVALVFSLLRVSPTPFCVLDEVDAMLDEANVGRFRELLRELSATTQFIMITHNRASVQVADIIYGVTMGRDSTSQILSLKIDELEKVIN